MLSDSDMHTSSRSHQHAIFPRFLAYSITSVIVLAGCASDRPSPPRPFQEPSSTLVAPHPPQETISPAPQPSTPENLTGLPGIAQSIVGAAPVASPADEDARDKTAAALGACTPLLAASEFHVYFGAFDPEVGFDLGMARLTALQPLVLAKSFLSLFMFDGTWAVREDESGATIVELPALFRDKLKDSAYPQAFWHSPDEWQAIASTKSLLLVFNKQHLGAVMYVPDAEKAKAVEPRMFDGRWRWKDGDREQPRSAMFDYVLSADNPHVAKLTEAYKQLEPALIANSCMKCHAPDNRSRMRPLVILTHPAQALAPRHSIGAVVREDHMPPGDVRRGIPRGIRDEQAKADLLGRADAFDEAATAALRFEMERLKIDNFEPPIPPPRGDLPEENPE
jgi:hypothetical protein